MFASFDGTATALLTRRARPSNFSFRRSAMQSQPSYFHNSRCAARGESLTASDQAMDIKPISRHHETEIQR
jgi:hypothetical protein